MAFRSTSVWPLGVQVWLLGVQLCNNDLQPRTCIGMRLVYKERCSHVTECCSHMVKMLQSRDRMLQSRGQDVAVT
jgi:hypothetical protein